MLPDLAGLQRRQRGVFRRSQALACGYTHAEIQHLLETGAWTRVRHGVYTSQRFRPEAVLTDRATYLLAAAARLLVIEGDTVLSHGAAAAWHRIEVLGAWPVEPSLTRHRPAAMQGMTAHGLYVAPVPIEHRVPAAPVSTVARTVIDCARAFGEPAGLVAAESALRGGLDRQQLLDVLDYCSGWPGVAGARRAVELADEWSETAIESLTRLWCKARGLPSPQQQLSVWSLDGRFLAEVDFVWKQYRTVLEMDGRKKYLGDEAALWREKVREDGLRDSGLEVVRGYWEDVVGHGELLRGRLERAFARGSQAAAQPLFRLGPPTRRPARPFALAG